MSVFSPGTYLAENLSQLKQHNKDSKCPIQLAGRDSTIINHTHTHTQAECKSHMNSPEIYGGKKGTLVSPLVPCLTLLSDTMMSVMPIFCKLPPSTPVRSGQFSSHFSQEAELELGLDAQTDILPSAAHIM